jgi:hypothetical protein
VSELGVIPVSLSVLEHDYPEIVATKNSREWTAYTRSLKPFLLEFLLKEHTITEVTYVDPTVYFWAQPARAQIELGNHSFMVTGPGQRGNYFNGCFFSCKNDDNTAAFLTWWKERCVEWCACEEHEERGYAEARYLNILRDEPDKFPGAYLSQNPGLCATPWGSLDAKWHEVLEGIAVDEHLLISYNYQGYVRETKHFNPKAPRVNYLPTKIVNRLYRAYHEQLPVTKPPAHTKKSAKHKGEN